MTRAVAGLAVELYMPDHLADITHMFLLDFGTWAAILVVHLLGITRKASMEGPGVQSTCASANSRKTRGTHSFLRFKKMTANLKLPPIQIGLDSLTMHGTIEALVRPVGPRT